MSRIEPRKPSVHIVTGSRNGKQMPAQTFDRYSDALALTHDLTLRPCTMWLQKESNKRVKLMHVGYKGDAARFAKLEKELAAMKD